MKKEETLIEMMDKEIAKWFREYDGSDIYRNLNDRFK
jgi:hypothetical protein